MRLLEESFDSARQTLWDIAGDRLVKVGQAVKDGHEEKEISCLMNANGLLQSSVGRLATGRCKQLHSVRPNNLRAQVNLKSNNKRNLSLSILPSTATDASCY
jgi:hypothetical protein